MESVVKSTETQRSPEISVSFYPPKKSPCFSDVDPVSEFHTVLARYITLDLGPFTISNVSRKGPKPGVTYSGHVIHKTILIVYMKMLNFMIFPTRKNGSR